MGFSSWFRGWLLADVCVCLTLLYNEVRKMSAAFDLMESKVAELKTVNESVLALIAQLVTNLSGATTMAEVQQIVAEIDAEKTKLADAVTANTPGPVA